jgi:hypothetical protein
MPKFMLIDDCQKRNSHYQRMPRFNLQVCGLLIYYDIGVIINYYK